MATTRLNEQGFTIAEMAMALIVISIVVVSVLGLFTALVKSAVVAKRKAVASTLAANQMEYLKSLPYDNLAIAGGSIYASNPLPATSTQTLDGAKYTITTSISYIDDAYDGCGSYPNITLKQLYCRNYPPPAGAPATDTNPQDYKIVNVKVSLFSVKLAEVDTQISARVAETASTTGALFVTVIDDSGNPVSGANVQVINNTLSPVLNLLDNTDENGIAIFYGLPPDNTNYHYTITASLNGYSTLTTIPPSGALQPNYSSQNIFTQQSSSVTLTIKPQGSNSLVLETTNTSGVPLASVKVYVKGGYKKYVSAADTTYYFDNKSPADTRPTTDAQGLASISNLVPGGYIFCGDSGSTNCVIGGTMYYLAAAIPYGSPEPNNPFLIDVPTYDAASPPATTFNYSGLEYLQKVRLILTTDSSFPRINVLTPYTASISGGGLNSYSFEIDGQNLPCSNNPASCGTSVKFVEGASIFVASCTGTTGTKLNCTIDLSAASPGNATLVLSVGAKILTLPTSPGYGGIVVSP